MNLKELFEKIYKKEITENDVIVETINDCDKQYKHYIVNDGFDFWYNDGDCVISLNFFINENTENYKRTYLIISKQEFESQLEEIKKQEQIRKLEEQIEKFKKGE